jgi:hypothetical protein
MVSGALDLGGQFIEFGQGFHGVLDSRVFFSVPERSGH